MLGVANAMFPGLASAQQIDVCIINQKHFTQLLWQFTSVFVFVTFWIGPYYMIRQNTFYPRGQSISHWLHSLTVIRVFYFIPTPYMKQSGRCTYLIASNFMHYWYFYDQWHNLMLSWTEIKVSLHALDKVCQIVIGPCRFTATLHEIWEDIGILISNYSNGILD